jgi:hypothetical protein
MAGSGILYGLLGLSGTNLAQAAHTLTFKNVQNLAETEPWGTRASKKQNRAADEGRSAVIQTRSGGSLLLVLPLISP